jgi:CO dehydrogenase/acetyl-CoA synthase delta subunit
MKKQKLNLDLEALFPGSALTIGNESIIIRPLNIEQLAILSKKVSGLGSILSEKNITIENFNTPENLFHLAVIALDNVPDVLEEAANVEMDSLKQLPIEVIAQIIEKIISENIKSKEVLEKNFKSLIEKFQTPVKEIPKKK